jgi:hypothetical protein
VLGERICGVRKKAVFFSSFYVIDFFVVEKIVSCLCPEEFFLIES